MGHIITNGFVQATCSQVVWFGADHILTSGQGKWYGSEKSTYSQVVWLGVGLMLTRGLVSCRPHVLKWFGLVQATCSHVDSFDPGQHIHKWFGLVQVTC